MESRIAHTVQLAGEQTVHSDIMIALIVFVHIVVLWFLLNSRVGEN